MLPLIILTTSQMCESFVTEITYLFSSFQFVAVNINTPVWVRSHSKTNFFPPELRKAIHLFVQFDSIEKPG